MNVFYRATTALAVAGGLGLVARPAMAADMPLVVGNVVMPFDIAFGVKGLSDWTLRGITQTDGGPAIQGYAELQAFDWVYAGIWASNLDFGGTDPSAEIDYYGGVRHSFDALTLDAGFVWVNFSGEQSSPGIDYGKFYGIAKYALTEDLTIGANIYYGDDFINRGASITHASAFAKYVLPFKPMPDVGLYVSGAFSRQWTSKNFSPDYYYWEAGLGATYKAMTLDFRYTNTDLKKRECFGYIGDRNWCGDRYMVSLAFDTSLSKLK